MTVAAAHAGGKHPALKKRSVNVDFIQNLAVELVEPLDQELRAVGIEESAVSRQRVCDQRAPRVTGRTYLNLGHSRARLPRRPDALRSVRMRRPGSPPDQLFEEATGALRVSLPGPAKMSCARAMTCLAPDIDFGEGGLIEVAFGIILLAYGRRMTIRAHLIPAKRRPFPMQDVSGRNLAISLQTDPTLAATFLRPAIPSQRQCLQAALVRPDKILLQGIHPESVQDVHGSASPVGLDDLHPMDSILLEKPRPEVPEIRANPGEITENRARFAHGHHRAIVVGPLPGGENLRMTGPTGFRADVPRFARRCRRAPREQKNQPKRYFSKIQQNLPSYRATKATSAHLTDRYLLN